MRKVEVSWNTLEKSLKASGVLMEDDKHVEKIDGVTLAKPRILVVFTKEVKG